MSAVTPAPEGGAKTAIGRTTSGGLGMSANERETGGGAKFFVGCCPAAVSKQPLLSTENRITSVTPPGPTAGVSCPFPETCKDNKCKSLLINYLEKTS